MKFKKLTLYTNQLENEFVFYSKTLGFDIVKKSTSSFCVKIGWSELTFIKSEKNHKYHYCFLIPCNQLDNALLWIEDKIDIIEIEKGKKIQHFEVWNADSFYFYDASGNVAEFIVRHDLNNTSNKKFSISDVLCINEIGIPTTNIEVLNNKLNQDLNTTQWKGDYTRFGTNGDLEGIFLLPNYLIKEYWFPTKIKIKPEPFSAIIENKEINYLLEYSSDCCLNIKPLGNL